MASRGRGSKPRQTRRGSMTEREAQNYEAMRESVYIPGAGPITFTGENRFDDRAAFDNASAAFSMGPTGAVPRRWGAGVPVQEQEDIPIYTLGPNGERVPVAGAGMQALSQGTVSGPTVYGAALDPNAPDAVNSLWAMDGQGNVAWGSSSAENVKFAQQRQKALEEVVAEWSEQNDGAVPNDQQMAQLGIIADQRAMSAVSFLIGGNPDNYPASVAPQGAEAIYQAGQILPGFIGGAGPNGRPIDETEAQALNWIRGSETIPTDQRDMLMRSLFDPMVPDEQKREVITQVTGQINMDAANAQPVEDGFDWTWNPLALSWEVITNFALKPLETLYSDYVDPSLSWTVSALPGGPRTASWEEAQSVAPGQMIATALGARGAALALGPVPGMYAMLNPGNDMFGDEANEDRLSFAAGMGQAILENEAPWTGLGDGIYDAEQREAAFEDSYLGSMVSGGIGFSTALIWDPLILAGPVVKGVRVSHRLGMGMGAIKSMEDVAKQNELLTIGRNAFGPYEEARTAYRAAVQAGDDARIAQWEPEVAARKAAKDQAMKKQAPVVQFIDWLLDPASGKRAWQEIEQHKVIQDLGAPEYLVTALADARTFDDAALTLRAMSNDEDALRALKDLNFQSFLQIRALKLQTSIDNIFSAPDKLARLEGKYDTLIDDALAEVRRLEDEAMLVDTGWQARLARFEAATPTERATMATPEEMIGSPQRRSMQMMEEGNRQIDYLMGELKAARADGAPQGVIEDLLRRLDEAASLANDGLFGKAAAEAFPAEARAAHRRLARALDDRNMIVDARNRGRAWTDEQRDIAARTLDDLERRNVTYRSAIRAAEDNSTAMTNMWFGRGRLQGMARNRERAFQRRAERRAFQMQTHRSGMKWVPQYFTAPGGQRVTLWGVARGAGQVAADAITRPFTYAAMESPAAFIRTDGLGGLDNYKEFQATVNNLKSLTADQREMIIERFSRMSATSSDGMVAVQQTEKDIIRAIATRYANDVDAQDIDGFMEDIELMYKFFDQERSDMIQTFRDRGFWVDEDGVINKSPFLESQLMNSTPLMDFRRLERLVERYAKDYSKSRRGFSSKARATDAEKSERIAQARLRRSDEQVTSAEAALARAEAKGAPTDVIDTARLTVEKSKSNQLKLKQELDNVMSDSAKFALANSTMRTSWDKGLQWYDDFQQLWRFGVLFRVGYPVRNSIEGVFRRIAYDASLVPVITDGVRGTRNIASNVRTGRSTLTPEVVKERKARKARESLTRKGSLPRSVAKWANREQERITTFRGNQIEFRDMIRSSMDELESARAGMPAGPARDELDLKMAELAKTVRSFDFVISDLDVRLAPFADTATPDELIAVYRQSLDRPRKVGDEFIYGVDGRAFYGMRGDPRMSPIMEANASARETTQSTIGLRLSASRALAEAAVLTLGGEVLPSARNYFPELTKILNQQVRNSIVGDGFLKGKSIDDVAREVMRGTDNAREYRTIHKIRTIEEAEDQVAAAYRELGRYMPNPELRRALSRGQVTERMIRDMLDNDDYRSLMVPVHGALIGPAVGHAPGVVKRLQNFSDKAFEVIGTMPEDAIVRLPFASRVYERNLKAGLSLLAERYPDGVPSWAVDRVINQARTRAIKDTKRFMFTQDRRTNFGRVGERFIPFISAWQNSIIAYGRLTARNPETLYFAEQAWLAPDRIGIVDADGNMRIPVPEWMVGKTMYVPGVGDVPISGTVGDEWVYDKASAYVIVDNTDPALTFKSGPVFQMAASTLMQAGWVGPEAPPPFRAVFGDEYAQKIWDAGVLATFGADEYGRAATMGVLPLGADKVLPAWAQKVVQVVQTGFGNSPENNSTYNTYYINNARQMFMDWRMGMRDSVPSVQEIKDRTNGQFFIRGMSNLFGVGGPLGPITPTQQQSEINQVQELYFMFQDMYGMEADQHFATLFGDELAWVASFRGSKSVAGAPANKRALIRAQDNEELIRAVAPNLESKSMLYYLLSDGNYQADSGDAGSRVEAWFGLLNPDSGNLDRFDPNVRLVQFLQTIPGTSENWRNALTPEESARQASIDSGWDLYFKANQAIYAELDAMGVSSIQSAEAAGLAQQRRDFIKAMAQDPLYVAWYDEYNKGFQSRTRDALNLIRTTTSNENFMSGPGSDATDMWQAAGVWLGERRKYMSEIARLGGTGDDVTSLRKGWEVRSAEISTMNPRFREFWSRYLDNDDLSVE